MSDLVLKGLDGAAPRGFLASLGVLDIAARASVAGVTPRLGWQHSGTWRPVLTGIETVGDLAALVLSDARSTNTDKLFGFSYLKLEKRGAKPVQALTPPVAVLRAYLRAKLDEGAWEIADFASCLMCENASTTIASEKRIESATLASAGIPFDPVTSLTSAALQTPFDFTSRNAQFLDQILHVRDALSIDVVVDELTAGTGAACPRMMGWDATAQPPSALFSSFRPAAHPAAEWMAFRGLAFFGLVAQANRIPMPSFTGRRKAGRFSWVLWKGLLPSDVIRTCVARASLLTDAAERAARGCLAAFSVSMMKDATGYEGAVSPTNAIGQEQRAGRDA